MSPFQIVVIAFSACLCIGSLVAMVRGWLRRRECLAWAALWLAAAVAVARPSLVGAIAKALGIGRGADLVLYCSVIVMMIGFWMIYARLRAVRRELTILVRRLAIRDAIGTQSVDPHPTSEEAPKNDTTNG